MFHFKDWEPAGRGWWRDVGTRENDLGRCNFLGSLEENYVTFGRIVKEIELVSDRIAPMRRRVDDLSYSSSTPWLFPLYNAWSSSFIRSKVFSPFIHLKKFQLIIKLFLKFLNMSSSLILRIISYKFDFYCRSVFWMK